MIKSPTEVTIARSCYGRNQWDRCRMSVTTYTKTRMYKSTITWIRSVSRDNSLFQKGQSLSCLESRPRRELSHNGTIQQRLPRITSQFKMILTTLTTYHQTRIKSRGRCHAKDFSCRRFDSYYTTNLTFQQSLCQLLQFDINT